MSNYYKKIDPKVKLPPKTWVDPQYKTMQHDTSGSVFAMTDNGKVIVYYDYESASWYGSARDNWTDVEYWLEEIEDVT